MFAGPSSNCGLSKGPASSKQAPITREWDALAGDWDDLAGDHIRRILPHVLERLPSTNASRADDRSSSAEGRGFAAAAPSYSPFRVVDFGCGTGVLTQHLRKHCGSTSESCQILAVDASSKMIEILQDKILSREWTNVTAFCGVLADLHPRDEESYPTPLQDYLRHPADVVLASHVFMYLPEDDLAATVAILSKLLKPGGLLVHCDWVRSDEHPKGWSEEQLRELHRCLPGWTTESIDSISLASQAKVLLGVARKL